MLRRLVAVAVEEIELTLLVLAAVAVVDTLMGFFWLVAWRER
jgi:hypothetical protein